MRLLFLPGLDGTTELFPPVIRAVPDGVSPTIATYPTDGDQSYERLAREVATQLTPGEPYVVVAESFSGPLAVRLAATDSASFAGVVLCASFVYAPGTAWLRVIGRFLSYIAFNVSPPRWILRQLLVGPDASEELVDLFCAAAARVPAKTFGRRARVVLSADDRRTLASLPLPVLCIAPQRDRVLGRQSARVIATTKPAAGVVELDGPHCVLQRRPREVIELIVSWGHSLSQ